MTKEQLFSKETFYDLFSKDGAERIELETKLFLEAEKLGLEKKFEQTAKKYEKLFKEKIKIQDEKSLPKCKYDISNIKWGSYTCRIDGITDKYNTKFSYFPVIPVERYINRETNKEKVKIIYYKENDWKEMIVDKSQLAISQKLLLLSDYGLDVNSENVRYYINYFAEIMNNNDISKLESVSHLGWSGEYFIPYDSRGIFDGADDFRSIYNAISSKGNYDKWKEVVQKLRKHKVIKLLMATTFASPLLEKLNIQPFIVNLWSSLSGNGKTLSCMVAMSSWGNPQVGALTLSSNNTQNFYLTVASFMRNITCYFDELQIIKNSNYINFENLIMDLCNGTEKGRLNKYSQAKDVKIWFNNFIFTNNDKMVNENAGEQIYNRVIDLEIREKLVDKGQDIAKIIKENYGFAGKEYIKYIEKIGIDFIFERYKALYNEIIKTTKSTDKQANIFAILLLANELSNECIFNDEEELKLEDIEEYINDKDEIKTSLKAKNYILNIIDINAKKFEENYSYGEIWGQRNEYFCLINLEILKKELKKGGFEFDTVKKDWADMGFLQMNSQGRYVHSTSTNSKKGSYVKLKSNI